MLWVGLTGGTGSGKSTAAAALAGCGALVIDADALARRVVEPGTPGLARIGAEFGDHLIRPDGTLDRPALARIVFADRERLRALEAITHPEIRHATEQARRLAPADAVAVHDMPLIVENGTAPRHHLVIVVDAPAELRVRRLAGRGMDAEDARARIAHQATTAQRREVADLWLDNSGTRQDLEVRVQRVWDRLARFEQHLRDGVPAAPDPAWPADPGADGRAAARLRYRLGESAAGLRTPEGTAPGTFTLTRTPHLAAAKLDTALAGAGLVPDGSGGYGCADPGQRVRLRLTGH